MHLSKLSSQSKIFMNSKGYLNTIESKYIFIDLNLYKGELEVIKESLKLENTLWCNTVLASGKILALVLYTGKILNYFIGKDTRMSMNSREARTKMGRLDNELNFLSKLLFAMMVILSLILVLLGGMSFD